MHVEIKYIGNGWDVSLVDGPEERTAWAMTGIIAFEKASEIANFYRDENGQQADIIWKHKVDEDGNIVEVQRETLG